VLAIRGVGYSLTRKKGAPDVRLCREIVSSQVTIPSAANRVVRNTVLFKRAARLALAVLLGQFMLVGSGYACSGRAHSGDGAAHTTPSMSVRAAPDEHAGCTEAPRTAHCMLSGFSCTTIGACGVGPMMALAVSGSLGVRLTSQDTLTRTGAAPTRSVAPEPPPPRA
jgi:hypothetical protein